MDHAAFAWERFNNMPIVGISRNIPLDTIRQILPLYRNAGLSTIEITMNTAGAEEIIRYTRSAYGDHLNVGAGTVCSLEDLHRALSAGAQFIVTPVLIEPVVRQCAEQGIPAFPGAFTPTEIFRAWSLGAAMVKIFPATALGPGYLKDLKGPLNQIRLLPTGGVDLNNMPDYMRAGASGVGVGSELFDKQLIQAGKWPDLLSHFKSFVQSMRAVTGES